MNKTLKNVGVFDLFLEPYNMNAGGLSGLAMVLVHLLKKGTVGTVTMLINIPLFAFGGWKIGKKFEDMPEKFFVKLFSVMFVGMAPLTCISAIISEEKLHEEFFGHILEFYRIFHNYSHKRKHHELYQNGFIFKSIF